MRFERTRNKVTRAYPRANGLVVRWGLDILSLPTQRRAQEQMRFTRRAVAWYERYRGRKQERQARKVRQRVEINGYSVYAYSDAEQAAALLAKAEESLRPVMSAFGLARPDRIGIPTCRGRESATRTADKSGGPALGPSKGLAWARLSESEAESHLGTNRGRGRAVTVRLRKKDGCFRSESAIIRTLLHELAHCKFADHGPKFRSLDARLVEFAIQKGIYTPASPRRPAPRPRPAASR
jgi:hypothetical protein